MLICAHILFLYVAGILMATSYQYKDVERIERQMLAGKPKTVRLLSAGANSPVAIPSCDVEVEA